MRKYRYSLTLVIIASLFVASAPAATGVSNSIGSQLNRLPQATRVEIARARAATAKYHNVSRAIADGYVNFNIFISGQGEHFVKASLADTTFDPEKPEVLLYAHGCNGGCLRLVGFEYTVPLALSATPPEGFTGDQDVWIRDEHFGFWSLHTWFWLHNPNGIFAEFNPRIP